ncbi:MULTISPECIES: hemerythrin domain-containing protein [Delftia]|uniref:hemerythrin domain-containing protein n=1 Tax=Delftia TaxID=80865 RepID=UPI00177CED8D|nr:hemerythrin domain-containing protein [Delftia sp. DLF01]MBD9584884.1 hemerythrin [Delftia sp. DLF01]
MAVLEWSGALALELPAMDEVHQEFVLLLAEVEAADDAQLCARWDELIAHTQVHFDQEDRWMQSTRFTSTNCHSLQHKVVLQVMREGASKAADGDLAVIRSMAGELAAWFVHHAQTMDAALALHLRSAGFDPATGSLAHPEALPEQPITGCGGACDGSADRARAVPA